MEAEEVVVSSNEGSSQRRQFTLAGALGWLVYCAAFFTILGSYSVLVEAGLKQTPLPASRVVPLFACWLILLWYFIRQRQSGPIAVHTIPPALILLLLLLAQDLDYATSVTMVMAACWSSAVLSFVISLLKSLEVAVQRDSSPLVYLVYNVVGAVILTCGVCTVIPTFARGVVHWPSVVYGVLLGVWLGAYQAVATSSQLRNSHIYGLPARPFLAAGFLFASFGAIAAFWINRYLLSNVGYPLRYTPIFLGLPAAILAGLIARWRRV